MTEPWIQTMTGKRFTPLNPRPADIDIHDIAYALSGEYRFAGHCVPRITVAQHSVLVSRCVPLDCALWGLLHDASEAYCRDLSRPIKHHPGMTAYRAIEHIVQQAVCERFGLPHDMPESVHVADDRVMATESVLCMYPRLPGFFDSCHNGPPEPYPDLRITPWGCRKAERKFLARFAELQGVCVGSH